MTESIAMCLRQVMILPRADFFEYFEGGITSCANAGAAVSGQTCRQPQPWTPDPNTQTL